MSDFPDPLPLQIVDDRTELLKRIEILEEENGRLRARLNDARYLARRALALLSSHRNLTLGLAGAAAAALLLMAGGGQRLVDAWQQLAKGPRSTTVHAYRSPTISPGPAWRDDRTQPVPVGSPADIQEATTCNAALTATRDLEPTGVGENVQRTGLIRDEWLVYAALGIQGDRPSAARSARPPDSDLDAPERATDLDTGQSPSRHRRHPISSSSPPAPSAPC